MKISFLGNIKALIAVVVMTSAMGAAHAVGDCTISSPSVDVTTINTVALSVSEPLIGYGGSYGSGYAYRAPVTLSIACGSQASAWSLSADAGFTAVGNSFFLLVDPSTPKIVCAPGCGGSAAAVTGTGNATLSLEAWCTGGSSAYPKCFDGPVSPIGLIGKPLTLTSPGGTTSATLSFGGTRAYSCTINSPVFNIGSLEFKTASIVENSSASASTSVYKVAVSLDVSCDSAPSVQIFGPSTPVLVTVGGTPDAGQAMLYQASTKTAATITTPYSPGATIYGTKTFSDLQIWLSGSAPGQAFGTGNFGSFSAVVPITLNY